MTYVCIALALGLAVALYFVRREKMRRTAAEVLVKTLFDVDGWHDPDGQDYVKGSATWKKVDVFNDAVRAPYLHTPFVVRVGFGREVASACNKAEQYGRTTGSTYWGSKPRP